MFFSACLFVGFGISYLQLLLKVLYLHLHFSALTQILRQLVELCIDESKFLSLFCYLKIWIIQYVRKKLVQLLMYTHLLSTNAAVGTSSNGKGKLLMQKQTAFYQ